MESAVIQFEAYERARVGAYDEAIVLLKRAEDVRESFQALDEDARIRTLMVIGSWQRRAGRPAEARETWEKSFGDAETRFGAEKGKLIPWLENYADFLATDKDQERALGLYQRAARLSEEDPAWVTFAARMYMKASNMQSALGRFDDAERSLHACSESAVNVFGPISKEAAITRFQLAVLYEDQARWLEAEENAVAARDIATRISSEDVGVPYCLGLLGRLYSRQEKNDLAIPTLRRRSNHSNRQAPTESPARTTPGWPRCSRTLGTALCPWAATREAQPLLERGATLLGPANRLEQSLWDDWLNEIDERQHARALRTLGRLYTRLGRYAEAEPIIRKALEIRMTILPANHWYIGESLLDLGEVLIGKGKAQEALEPLGRAASIAENRFGVRSVTAADVARSQAHALSELGRKDEAEERFQNSLGIREERQPMSPALAADLNDLGVLYLSSARLVEAEPVIRRALEIFEKTQGPAHTQYRCDPAQPGCSGRKEGQPYRRRSASRPLVRDRQGRLSAVVACHRIVPLGARSSLPIAGAARAGGSDATRSSGDEVRHHRCRSPKTVACRRYLEQYLASGDSNPGQTGEGNSVTDSR
jgi:tetratricopeptide (TPR) repeat protein